MYNIVELFYAISKIILCILIIGVFLCSLCPVGEFTHLKKLKALDLSANDLSGSGELQGKLAFLFKKKLFTFRSFFSE